MQLLKGLWQSDRDAAKIAAKEAAKAEAEAAKAEKGGRRRGNDVALPTVDVMDQTIVTAYVFAY